MELVDRYLQAVKFWLPRDQKDDIIAELSEDLRSQVEEKESELGHPLSKDEIEPILKRCGAPMAVAARYLPQRSLIGPALFPIYSLIIRSLFLYYLFPWLLLWIGIAIFSPGFRDHHPGLGLWLSLEPWWLACTHSLFICTLIFALLDRSQARARMAENWNPHTLPALRDANRIPRSGTVIELAVSVCILAWYFEVGAFHREFHALGLDITLTSIWPYFFWALTLFSIGNIVLAFMKLLDQRWTRLTATLTLGINCYCFALAYWLFRARPLQALSADNLSPAEADHIVGTINTIASLTSLWVLVVGAAVLIFNLRRILRVAAPGEPS